ncbi:hypothetical protein [Streptomyces sp. NEAU-W12]|uniref:hypothetical protein n=1 Tax=Streptomyces sp. NEAU-W12 TaxID=2994668 RepID=UPI003A4C5A3C
MMAFGLMGWPVAWFGMLYLLIVFLSQRFIPLFLLPLCYAFYRAALQFRQVAMLFRIRSVIREYPWQIILGIRRGIREHPEAEDKGIWIELPDPAGRSDAGIPLVFVKHHRAFWWLRRIGGPRTKPALKARLEPLWFAGDPRFLGVVAVSSRDGKAPRRLHFLYQPSAFDRRAPRRSWEGVELVDLERARRAGARFVDVPSTAVSGVKGGEGAET